MKKTEEEAEKTWKHSSKKTDFMDCDMKMMVVMVMTMRKEEENTQ